MIEQACYDKDERELKEKLGSKCSNMSEDAFKVHDYMKVNALSDIRELFRIKTRMNKLRANFPSDPKCRAEGGMVCLGCGANMESNSHVTECAAYAADLLVGRDLDDDGDLVKFFRDVMARREEIEKKHLKAS